MIETSKAKSLKAKINNYANLHKLSAQAVLQNYIFEILLDDVSFKFVSILQILFHRWKCVRFFQKLHRAL